MGGLRLRNTIHRWDEMLAWAVDGHARENGIAPEARPREWDAVMPVLKGLEAASADIEEFDRRTDPKMRAFGGGMYRDDRVERALRRIADIERAGIAVSPAVSGSVCGVAEQVRTAAERQRVHVLGRVEGRLSDAWRLPEAVLSQVGELVRCIDETLELEERRAAEKGDPFGGPRPGSPGAAASGFADLWRENSALANGTAPTAEDEEEAAAQPGQPAAGL